MTARRHTSSLSRTSSEQTPPTKNTTDPRTQELTPARQPRPRPIEFFGTPGKDFGDKLDPCKMFCGGVPRHWGGADLARALRGYGKAKDAWIAESQDASRGFGFAVVWNPKDVDKMMKGRESHYIYVDLDNGLSCRFQVKHARTRDDMATDSTASPQRTTGGRTTPSLEVPAAFAQQQTPIQQFAPPAGPLQQQSPLQQFWPPAMPWQQLAPLQQFTQQNYNSQPMVPMSPLYAPVPVFCWQECMSPQPQQFNQPQVPPMPHFGFAGSCFVGSEP